MVKAYYQRFLNTFLWRQKLSYEDFWLFIGLLMILLHQMQNVNIQMREKPMRKRLKNIR